MMFRRQRELACQQAVELVTDYIEGSMSRADRRRFEAHLSSCPHCTAYLAQMRSTIQLTGRLRSEELPSEVREELVGLFTRCASAHIDADCFCRYLVARPMTPPSPIDRASPRCNGICVRGDRR